MGKGRRKRRWVGSGVEVRYGVWRLEAKMIEALHKTESQAVLEETKRY